MSLSEKYTGPALALVATVIAVATIRKKWGSKHPPYPPGPKGYPIIGSVLDMPQNPIWEGFDKLAREYDTDVLHLDVLGSHIVVLRSTEAVMDLLERRSAIYSDRPRLPMVTEVMECSWSFAMMHYGSTWRVHRRLFHRFLNISVSDRFDDKIRCAVNTFLQRLSASPECFLKHAHFLTGSLGLDLTYGLNVDSESDKYYAASEEAMNAVDVALLPGAFLVDVFPTLQYVPAWFPGAGFKTFGKKAKKSIDNLANLPFEHVKQSLQAGTAVSSSFVASSLENLPEIAEYGADEEAIRAVGATMFLGGEEGTSALIQGFFLAMTLHPEVVHLAQQELDELLGGERLPDYSDMPRLPYVSAVIKEVMRWRVPNPLGTPHRLMEDDVYKGYFIPAGTTVFGSLWSMFQDESVYPDPDLFKPERFIKDGQLDPDVKDPEAVIFGWGRRVCPGRHFAQRLLFVTVASTLAAFDISKALDEDGNPITPKGEFTLGLVRNPLPFKSNVRPRSARALSLVSGH